MAKLSREARRVYARLNQNRIGSLLARTLRWTYWNTPFHRLALLTPSPTLSPDGDVSRVALRIRSPVCANVKTWCEQHGYADYQVIAPPQSYIRKTPSTIEPDIHQQFRRKLMSVEVPEKYLARVPNARLVGSPGLVVLPDGSFAVESVDHPDHVVADPAYYSALPSSGIKKRGRYYSLVFEYALRGNYYHWTHDVVLRLHGVREVLPESIRFIVPRNLKPYQYETLRLLDIGPGQLDYFDGRDLWELEDLYFSPPTTVSGVDSPDADKWFRELVLLAYGLEHRGRRRRIFVSRRLAGHRRLVNESEVERYLKPYGFETFTLETMSFREQVALFSEAEIVVASHGAALTNILYQAESIPVVDILETKDVNKCYWGMCEALGHRYWYLLGETVPNKKPYADIRVPLPKLEATLRQIGL